MADPDNYVLTVKAGVTRLTLPGEGVAFTAGDAVEMTVRQFQQMTIAQLAAVDITQAPAPVGGLTPEQLANLATTEQVAEAMSSKVTVAPLTTDSQASGASTFTWQEIPSVCQRGIMSRLTITPSGAGKYDIELRSEAAGGGELLLAATDADGAYDITVPVYVEGDDNSSIWLGTKNKGTDARTYTVTALRVEKFA